MVVALVVATVAPMIAAFSISPVSGDDDGGVADAVVRIDTPGEANYYRNGGIMQYVLRNLRRS